MKPDNKSYRVCKNKETCCHPDGPRLLATVENFTLTKNGNLHTLCRSCRNRKYNNADRRERQRKRHDAKNREGIIYFLFAKEFNAVKIGFSSSGDINWRISRIQTGYPGDLELLKMIEATLLEENDYHRRFYKYHLSREWFKVEGELAEFLYGGL